MVDQRTTMMKMIAPLLRMTLVAVERNLLHLQCFDHVNISRHTFRLFGIQKVVFVFDADADVHDMGL